MNYKVLIPPSVKRKIGKLPPGLPAQVLKKLLGELQSAPNSVLAEVVFPLAARAYPFTLTDKTGKPHWFSFLIDGVDPAANSVLRVIDFRHTEFDPSLDQFPEDPPLP